MENIHISAAYINFTAIFVRYILIKVIANSKEKWKRWKILWTAARHADTFLHDWQLDIQTNNIPNTIIPQLNNNIFSVSIKNTKTKTFSYHRARYFISNLNPIVKLVLK